MCCICAESSNWKLPVDIKIFFFRHEWVMSLHELRIRGFREIHHLFAFFLYAFGLDDDDSSCAVWMSFRKLERSLIESPEQQQESSIVGGAVQEKLREEARGRSAIYGSDEQRMKKKKRMIEYRNKVCGAASDKENTTSPDGQRQPPKKRVRHPGSA